MPLCPEALQSQVFGAMHFPPFRQIGSHIGYIQSDPTYPGGHTQVPFTQKARPTHSQSTNKHINRPEQLTPMAQVSPFQHLLSLQTQTELSPHIPLPLQ